MKVVSGRAASKAGPKVQMKALVTAIHQSLVALETGSMTPRRGERRLSKARIAQFKAVRS